MLQLCTFLLQVEVCRILCGRNVCESKPLSIHPRSLAACVSILLDISFSKRTPFYTNLDQIKVSTMSQLIVMVAKDKTKQKVKQYVVNLTCFIEYTLSLSFILGNSHIKTQRHTHKRRHYFYGALTSYTGNICSLHEHRRSTLENSIKIFLTL